MKFDKFVEAGKGKSAQPVEPSQSQMSKVLYSVIARNPPIKFYNPLARKGYLDSLSGPRSSSIVTQKTGKDAWSIEMANKNAVDELAAATSSGDNSSTVWVKCPAFFGIIRHMPAISHSDGIYGLIRNCVVADRLGGLVMSVFMPTDYKNDKSERKFVLVCKKLATAIADARRRGFKVVLTGDMNCDMRKPNSLRTQVFLSSCEGLEVLCNDHDFTYVHNSSSTSAFDFFLESISNSAKPIDHVNAAISASDHFPITTRFNLDILSLPAVKEKKWITKSERGKDRLAAISNRRDKCAELIHAMWVADTAAVSSRKVRVNTEVPKWNQNPVLVEICRASKYWYRIWCKSGRPRSGVVNDIRIHLKLKFSKALTKHRSDLIDENSAKIDLNPKSLLKFNKCKKRDDCNDASLLPSERAISLNLPL
ncbi:hypothetical protein QYM36_020087 [Artemia franciscana]|uniref:Endonuclease/exonuclease/phosphatase domain-containing protein n=1 Tax=Artemia franciscana TaxID=6661 RepID=A0AA88KQJ8_ARTSF|nr:hypothetical protein QYM36_020087 [Artemia franciscana]